MGYYITDPTERARLNAGLPPDECLGPIYVMDERERRNHEFKMREWDAQQRVREEAAWRTSNGWPPRQGSLA